MIDANSDPVLQAGIRHWTEFVEPNEEKRKTIPVDTVPLILYFSPEGNGQYVIGYRPDEFSRMVEHYRKSVGAGAFTVAGAEGVNPQPSAPTAEPTAATEGTT